MMVTLVAHLMEHANVLSYAIVSRGTWVRVATSQFVEALIAQTRKSAPHMENAKSQVIVSVHLDTHLKTALKEYAMEGTALIHMYALVTEAVIHLNHANVRKDTWVITVNILFVAIIVALILLFVHRMVLVRRLRRVIVTWAMLEVNVNTLCVIISTAQTRRYVAHMDRVMLQSNVTAIMDTLVTTVNSPFAWV